MNRIKNLIAISAFSFLVMGLPAIASAQYGGQNDPYGRNGGYNNGGNRNNGYYGDIRSTLRDLKDRGKDFKRDVDRMNDRNNGGFFGRGDNRNLKDLANQFKKAADRLESQYGNGRDQYKSQDEARRVLDLGSQLDQEMRRNRSNGYLQGTWNQISNDLRVVANTYGSYYNNNRNNRYPQSGNGRFDKPSWWPF